MIELVSCELTILRPAPFFSYQRPGAPDERDDGCLEGEYGARMRGS